MKTISKLTLVLAVFAFAATAQQVAPMGALSRGVGLFAAANYGMWVDRITTGNSATGAATITVATANVTLPDGRQVFPFATTAPLLIGAGGTQETVTPTAVSNCTVTGLGYTACSITASFTYVHGNGEIVQSGTFGLEEAVNDAHAAGGGVVIIDATWVNLGGVNATMTANKGWTNVAIVDGRGTVSGSAFSYKVASNGANYAATAVSWY